MSKFVEEYEEIKDQLEGISFSARLINDSFKTTPACTFLLKGSSPSQLAAGKSTDAPKTFKLDKRGRSFESEAPSFIYYINFKGENLKNMRVLIVGADGKTKALAVNQYSGYAQCLVRDFCAGFQIEPKGSAGKPVLTSLDLYGFPAAGLDRLKVVAGSLYSSLNNLKTTIASADSKVEESQKIVSESEGRLEELKQELTSAEDGLENLNGDLEKVKNELTQLEIKRATVAEKLEVLTREKVSKENNCQQLSSQAENLNHEIAEISKELSGLVNDRSLISDEFRDYVSEGRKQSGVYIRLMVLPCFVMGLCAALLYNGAHDLLFGSYETSEDKLAALLLRVPFASVLGGIAYYSWVISEKFLNKIFEVESERLTLAKLLVIAKDTVFSTADELGVEKSEKFYLRTRLKIEMLKAYLSNNLGNSFEFATGEKKRASSLQETVEDASLRDV